MDKKNLNKLIRIHDSIYDVIYDITENTSDSALLAILAKNPYFRGLVGLNISAPAAVLIDLLKKVDEEDRVHICYNPSLPTKNLRKVAEKDESEYVRGAATTFLAERIAKTPKARPAELLKLYRAVEKIGFYDEKGVEKVLKELSEHPKFPKEKNNSKKI